MQQHIQELLMIKNRDPDSMTQADYDRRNYLAQELFGTISIHDAFARLHPEFCLATVIWIVSYGAVGRLKGDIYSSDGLSGASIKVHPHRDNLERCLEDALTEPNGLYLYFQDHSNILWLDPERQEIHRYDPQISKDAPEAGPVDSALEDFFSQILPMYRYMGNTLSREECVQNVRGKRRGYVDCFCQEYTLLYARNRLEGMNHLEAALDLVENQDRIVEEIGDFYAYMSLGNSYMVTGR